ncbi:Ribonuclease H-like domain containing protein, partial [Parasponia andersonii]
VHTVSNHVPLHLPASAHPIVHRVLNLCDVPRARQSKFQFCSSCQFAKSHKLPFVLSDSQSMKPFELIHTDVWGASLVASIPGVRYFLLFINDFSRFTWMYLLKTKDEAYPIFLKFKAMVET